MAGTVLGIPLVIFAVISWGIANAIARVGVKSVKVTSATILSLIASLLVALIIALVFEFEALVSVSWVAIGWFALTGLLHFACGRLCLYQSMRYIGAARGTSLANSYPIFVLIFAVMFLEETATLPVIIGTISIVGGVYLLLSEGTKVRAMQRNSILGYGYSLATALFWGAATVTIKHASQFGSPFVVLSFALFFGTVLLLAATGRNFEIAFKTERKAVNLLLFSGFINGVGLASFYFALAITPVVIVSPLSATSPLVTVLFVHLFLQRLERVTSQVLIGCFLVVAGGAVVAIF